jgi:undecaprenyl-diphosphatase
MHGATPAPDLRPTGRRLRVALLATGLTVLAAGMVVVRHGTVTPLERDLFRAVNGLPDALYPVVWPVLQLGAVLVGPLVALAAIATGRRRLAVAAVVATILKLGAERVVKALVSRSRPGTSIGSDIHARGDVHLTGESFVSGHAALVAALAVVATPYLPVRRRAVPWLLAAGVAVGRVYVGAHNPLDVVCGAALGVVIGLVADTLTRRPVARRSEVQP